ncbi:hypothetical protein P1P68_20390 [Streptomyces scabiei]|uniref:hypothetical protein n=1 Tax=Streptomyces scabiei TaxID=1930 RepID=UPI00298F7A57|nr:hypothetical protein [Streptomyces scabiei]MDW8807080.1 hypothetical protein [Streptomyces scabiei]
MGKRVLAAFGVAAPMGGVLASGPSAAPTSADAATSSTAERTGSSEEAQLRALPTTWCSAACRYCTPVSWKTVHPQIKALTGTYRFDYLKKPLAQHLRFVQGTRESADPVGTGDHVADFSSGDSASGLPTLTLPRKSPWGPGRRPASPLKNAPCQPAVKPYLSRLLSKDVQEHAIGAWSARTGVAPPAGRQGIFGHATTNPPVLGQFMSDGAALDRCRARLSLYNGDVHGADSPDPTSSASIRSTSRAPKAEPLLDTGCPLRPGSRRSPRREAISPTITRHPRKHA